MALRLKINKITDRIGDRIVFEITDKRIIFQSILINLRVRRSVQFNIELEFGEGHVHANSFQEHIAGEFRVRMQCRVFLIYTDIKQTTYMKGE